MRYRLVDGQGNFGSVDGDSPAAMRYRQCVRFQKKYGRYRKETVDFQLNFDDTCMSQK
jgi:DNA gyrase subunit A